MPKINFLVSFMCCDMILIHYCIFLNSIYIFTCLFIETVISSLRISYNIVWSYSHPAPTNARILIFLLTQLCFLPALLMALLTSRYVFPGQSLLVFKVHVWVRSITAFLF